MATLAELQAKRKQYAATASPEQLARLDALIDEAKGGASHPTMEQTRQANTVGFPGRVERLHALASRPEVRANPETLRWVHGELGKENAHAQKLAVQAEVGKLGPVEGALAALGGGQKSMVTNALNAVGIVGDKATKEQNDIQGPLALQNPVAAGVGEASIAIPGSVALASLGAPAAAASPAMTSGAVLRNTLGQVGKNIGLNAAGGYIFSDPDNRKSNAALAGAMGLIAPAFTKQHVRNVAANAEDTTNLLTAKVLNLSDSDVTRLVQDYGSLPEFGKRVRGLKSTITDMKDGKVISRRGNVPSPQVTSSYDDIAGEFEAIADRIGINVGEIVKDASPGRAAINPEQLRQRLVAAIEKRFPARVTNLSSPDVRGAKTYMEEEADQLYRSSLPKVRSANRQGELGLPEDRTRVVRGERVEAGPITPVGTMEAGRGAEVGPGIPKMQPSETGTWMPNQPASPRLLKTINQRRQWPEGILETPLGGPKILTGSADAKTPKTQRVLEGTRRPNPDYEFPYPIPENDMPRLAKDLERIADDLNRPVEHLLPGMVFEQHPPVVRPTEVTLKQRGMTTGTKMPGDPGYVNYGEAVDLNPDNYLKLRDPSIQLRAAPLEHVPTTLEEIHKAKVNRSNDLFNAAGKRPDPASLKYDPRAAADRDLLGALIGAEEGTVRLKLPDRLAEFLRAKGDFGVASDAAGLARKAASRGAGGTGLDQSGGSLQGSAWRNAYQAAVNRLWNRPRLHMNEWLSSAPMPSPSKGNPLHLLSPKNAENFLPNAGGENRLINQFLIDQLRFRTKEEE